MEVSEVVKDLIMKLLEKNPNKRLGLNEDCLEILSHPWFEELNWTMLLEK